MRVDADPAPAHARVPTDQALPTDLRSVVVVVVAAPPLVLEVEVVVEVEVSH